ncbi:MAG: FAD-binding protein [Clostridiaceae bacterium]
MNPIVIEGYEIDVVYFNTVVIGSGAAGYNAVNRLYDNGQKNIALITENKNAGTSRNTGSDKQTYYKLTLSGGVEDSVLEMAKTLYDGKCVDGEIALAEASSSVQSFLHLVELGVPFPRNRYGEFIGYKTDHDPRKRGTSVGPLTSKKMTEMLEKAAIGKEVNIINKHLVVGILTEKDTYRGVLCIDLSEKNPLRIFKLFGSKNIIYATGGPANIYKDSVYPHGHYGMSGIAFEAGVQGRNLTEWQYGLASVRPRWNVSGTYMQVLPKFISTEMNGENEREFLADYFENEYEAMDRIFLKGYQWPFDVRKLRNGSSFIDILVYIETKIKKRRVYLDYRENSSSQEIDFSKLSNETRAYLEAANAAFGSPIERLIAMNRPAYDFYLDKGIDLKSRPLEIALCAQHNNGGLATDEWWKTNIDGFFAAGEVAGSHGIYRPGGSALNAGQVGSMRAAQYIAKNCTGELNEDPATYFKGSLEQISKKILIATDVVKGTSNIKALLLDAQEQMSEIGASIRNIENMAKYLNRVKEKLAQFKKIAVISEWNEVKDLYRLYDVYISQMVYLSSMIDYQNEGGKSRGSVMYYDRQGDKVYTESDERFRFTLDEHYLDEMIQEVKLVEDEVKIEWRKRRPLPEESDFFENVWKEYRENENIY